MDHPRYETRSGNHGSCMYRGPDGASHIGSADMLANHCKTKTWECKMVNYKEKRDIISTLLVKLRGQM